MARFLGALRSHPLPLVGAASVGAAYLGLSSGTEARTPHSVYSFGSCRFGQLGVGSEAEAMAKPTLSEYLQDHDVRRVSAGGDSSGVVTADGSVFTFGCGGNSRLGHGAALGTPNQAVPQLVEGLRGKVVASLAVGEYHMAALTEEGEVLTWGKARAPQLGHADAARGCPDTVALPGGARVARVACGRQQTVAVTEAGEVYSWGQGHEGALGHGVKTNESRPRLVEGLKGKRVVDVACGREFTLALTSAGELWSWGGNDYGQLGQGHSVRYQRAPLRVAALQQRVVAVAAGEFHAAALGADGSLYTWGQGKEGQLGHGTRDSVSLPRLVEGFEGKAADVDCGGGHTAVVDTQRRLWLFGRGRSGQLGRGDQLESIAAGRADPTLVEALTKQQVTAVGLGRDHTLTVTTAR
eukprot:g6793.t1